MIRTSEFKFSFQGLSVIKLLSREFAYQLHVHIKHCLLNIYFSTDTYFKNTFNSLEAFASHARRKTIDDADVELMMKRYDFF